MKRPDYFFLMRPRVKTYAPFLILLIVIMVIFLSCMGAPRLAQASNETVTLIIDDYQGEIPVLVQGEDFDLYLENPTGQLADSKEDFADLLAAKEKEFKTLKFYPQGQSLEYQFGELITSNVVLEGKWVDIGSVQITFNFNNEEEPDGSGESQTREIKAGERLGQLPEPKRNGFVFLSWINEETGETVDAHLVPTHDMTIGAQWEPAQTLGTSSSSAIDYDKLAKSWEGDCYIGSAWGRSPAKFSLSQFTCKTQGAEKSFTTYLKGKTLTGTCATPTAGMPKKMHFGYRAELISSRKDVEEKGKVVYRIRAKAYHGSAPGLGRNRLGLKGWQQIEAYAKKTMPVQGWMQIIKRSSDPSISGDLSTYSLNGASYAIYADKDMKNEVQTLTLSGDTPHKEARAKSKGLNPGTYFVKEVRAPLGYAKDEKVYVVRIEAGKTVTVDEKNHILVDAPQSAELSIVIQKRDKETLETSPIEAAKLSGAEFTLKRFDNLEGRIDGTPTHTWVFTSNENGEVRLTKEALLRGDRLYVNSKDKPCLPLGTYAIEETKAPQGYFLPTQDDDPKNDAPIICTVTPDGEGENIAAGEALFNQNTVADQVKRGDFSFRKVDGETMQGLGHIPFILRAETTGERHLILTDENGNYSSENSWNKHSANTNGNDKLVASLDSLTDEIDTRGLDDEAGTWFGTTTNGIAAPPQDELAALPWGNYTLTELPCAANKGRHLVTRTFSIHRDKTTIDLGTIDDNPLHITTSARDSADDDGVITAGTKAHVIDHVSYDGLIPQKQYELYGTLIDKRTGSPLEINGEKVESKTVFSPTLPSGSAEVTFEFDATGLGKTDLVVFETLRIDGIELVHHADIDNESQTVRLTPEIQTHAKDELDGDGAVAAQADARISDEVRYQGLKPGETYILKGVLMSKKLGQPLLIHDQPVTASCEFKPEKSEGSATVVFDLDAYGLTGDVVVFETLENASGEVIAEHRDLSDTNQTVSIVNQEKLAKTGIAINPLGLEALLVGLCLILYRKRRVIRRRLYKAAGLYYL
jgi:hypothetical protein